MHLRVLRAGEGRLLCPKTIVSCSMVYRVGSWKDLIKRECPSTLEECDDADFQMLAKQIRGSNVTLGLMEHQIGSACFLASRMGGILADDMGLGKTRSALAALRILGGSCTPAAVVTPAGLRRSWKREAEIYWPGCRVVLADKIEDLNAGFDIAVISYGNLKKFIGGGGLPRFETLIVDEAHSFKNARAVFGEQKKAYMERIAEGEDPGVHRTALLFDLAASIPRVYCLTGTPVLSRPKELFNLLKLTRHPLGRNFISFSSRYCGGRQGRFGWVSDGCTNPDELKNKLRNHVLRRHKSKVLQLPAKKIERIEVSMDMNTHFRYASAWDDYMTMVRETRTEAEAARVWQARHLVQISLLRQICSDAKVEHAVERASTHLGKTVIFSTFSKTLERLAAELQKRGVGFALYDGSLNEKKRSAAVDSFQNDPGTRVFLAQTEAAKVGLTLTAATLTLFMDLVYTPADHFQAEDRCYRIGQDQEVKIEYLLCRGTVEDHLQELHNAKKSVIAKIFDEDISDSEDVLTVDVRKELLTRLRGEARHSKKQSTGELNFLEVQNNAA